MNIIFIKIKNLLCNLYRYRLKAVKNYYRKIRLSLNKFKKNPKIFIIGANKTGTTSMRELFREMNFNVAPQEYQEKYFDGIMRNSTGEKKKYFDEQIKFFVDKYQVFQDMPFSIKNFYKEVNRLYPKSFYILLNRDPDQWYISFLNALIKHTNSKDLKNLDFKKLKNNSYVRKGYLYDNMINAYFENINLEEINEKIKTKNFVISIFKKRNDDIKEFFKNSKNFIEINIKQEKDNSKITKFLNLSKKYLNVIPHMNKTKKT